MLVNETQTAPRTSPNSPSETKFRSAVASTSATHVADSAERSAIQTAANPLRNTDSSEFMVAGQSDQFAFQRLLQRHAEQCSEYIYERADEYFQRVKLLRRVTYGLFGTSLGLAVILNTIFCIQHVSIQELLIGNICVMLLFVLSAISFLNDRSLQPFRDEAVVGQVKNRLEVVLRQIDELLKLKGYLNRQKDRSEVELDNLIETKRNLEKQVSDTAARHETALRDEQITIDSLESLKARVAEKEGELQQLNQQCDKLSTQLAAIKLEQEVALDSYQSEVATFEEELARVQETKNQQELQVSELSCELIESRRNLAEIQQKCQDAAAKLASSNEQLDALMGTMGEARTTADWLRQENENLALQNKLAADKLAAVEQQSNEASLGIQQLGVAVAEKKSDLKLLDEQLLGLKTEVERQQFQRQTLIAEQQDLVRSINNSRQTLSGVESMLELALLTRVEHVPAETESNEVQRSQHCLQIHDESFDVDAFRIEKIAEAFWLLNENKSLRSANSELKDAVTERNKVRAERNRLDTENNIVQNQLTELQSAIQIAKDEYEAILLNVQTADQTYQSHLAQIEKLLSDSVELTMQRGEVETNLAELQTQANELHEQIANLHKQRTTLEENNIAATATLEGMLDNIERLHQEQSELSIHRDQLQEGLSDCKREIEEIESQLELRNKENEQAASQYNKLQSELDRLNNAHDAICGEIEQCKNQKAQLISQKEEIAMEIEHEQGRLEKTMASLQETEKALGETINRLIQAESRLAGLDEECVSRKLEIQQLDQQAKRDRQSLESMRQSLDQAQREKDRVLHEKSLAEDELASSQHAAAQCANQLATLEAAIAEAQSRIDDKEDSIAILQQKAQELMPVVAQVGIHQAQLEELRRSIKETNRESQDARDEYDTIIATSERASREHSELIKSSEQVKQKLVQLNSELHALGSEQRSREAELTQSNAKLDELRLQSKGLSEEIAEKTKERRTLLEELEGIAKDVDESQKVCRQWDDYKSKLRTENSKLEGELSKAKSELSELLRGKEVLVAEHRKRKDEIAMAERERLELDSAIQDKKNSLANLSSQENSAQQQIKLLDRECYQLQTKVDQVQSEIESRLQQIQSLDRTKKQQESELEKLRSGVHALRNESDALQAEIDARSSLKQDLQLDIDSQSHALQAIEANLKGQRAASERLEADLSALQIHLDEVDAEVKSSEQILANLQLDIESSKSTESDLSKQLAKLRSEEDALQIELAKKQSIDLDLKARLDQSRQELDLETTSLQSKRQQVQELTNVIDTHRASLEELELSLQNIEEELETKKEIQSSLEPQIKQLQNTLKLRADEVAQQERTHFELQRTIEDRTRELQQLAQQFEQQRGEKEQLQSKIEEMLAQESHTTEQLHQTELAFEKLRTEKSQYESQMRSELELAQLAIKDLHDQLAAKMTQAEQVFEGIRLEEQQVASLVAKKQLTDQEIQFLEIRKTSMVDELVELEQQIAEMQLEMESLSFRDQPVILPEEAPKDLVQESKLNTETNSEVKVEDKPVELDDVNPTLLVDLPIEEDLPPNTFLVTASDDQWMTFDFVESSSITSVQPSVAATEFPPTQGSKKDEPKGEDPWAAILDS